MCVHVEGEVKIPLGCGVPCIGAIMLNISTLASVDGLVYCSSPVGY